MAILYNPHSMQALMLRPIHTFGRHPASCLTTLAAPDISKIHALVRWTGATWELCDQSRNGTLINGQRPESGCWVPLQEGNTLHFGTQPDCSWLVVDLTPPEVCLFALDGSLRCIPLSPGENLLPREDAAEANLYATQNSWVLDGLEGSRPLADGDWITLADERWEFVLGLDLGATQQLHLERSPGAAPLFEFRLSQNEEHTTLHLVLGNERRDLGERIHHYMLLTLARQRLEDAQRGLDASSQGWLAMDELARMLGVDEPYLNIQIFRARQQVHRSLDERPSDLLLLERRRGELRFGAHPFRVFKGEHEESAFQPPPA